MDALLGVKQTSPPHRKMSANDPKRTLAVVAISPCFGCNPFVARKGVVLTGARKLLV